MSDNLCKWKSKYLPEYKCHEPPLAGKDWCILHSEEEDKDIVEFTRKVNERMAAPEKIDLKGCYFPEKFPAGYFRGRAFNKPVDFSEATFSEEVDFSRATFSQEAHFSEATFSQRADFNFAKFSQGADFGGAKFSQANFMGAKFSQAYFIRATFSQEVDFNGATFSQLANFMGTTFSQANFIAATFSQRAYFIAATFSQEAVFCFARFEGETIRFQDVDLSNASFLHSNIDKVDFRYCSFGNKDEKLLGFIPHRRQNVLRDEIDADDAVGTALVAVRERTGASPAPTQKTEKEVREEKYEPVRRLYLELKKNFEEKRDWNTAGDFHYGEMECRRKMKEGWLWRNISSLEAVYFWSSGYGERPKRAFVVLVLLVGFLFPIILSMDVFVPSFLSYLFNDQPFCLWNWLQDLSNSLAYSFEIATFTRVTRIGEVIKPDTSWDKWVLVSESILVYIQILLVALALRRKVKR